MALKRQLRISGHKDYVAVDLVDENGNISSTPFSLSVGKVATIFYKDTGEEPPRVYKTNITIKKDFSGIDAIDSEEFEFDFPFDELSEPHIRFN